MMPQARSFALVLLAPFVTGCVRHMVVGANEHGSHLLSMAVSSAASSAVSAPASSQDSSIPAGATEAAARLQASPRHGEWVTVKTSPMDSVIAWVVYPERKTKAPVVIVIHEIFGLSTWVRSVADQLAADGFIAIAPDLLTMKRTDNLTSEWASDSATAAIRTLKPEDVQRDLDAVAKYGLSLPAATKKYGVVGYCWGGSTSFAHAAHSPTLGAAVVYYGTAPQSDRLAAVKAPVLGLYGGDDARVGTTIPATDSAMQALGKSYEHVEFAGAGHGFLRAQDQRDGANLTAAKESWPRTIVFLRKYLGA
jgi:carboxymethylenebutenolidase